MQSKIENTFITTTTFWYLAHKNGGIIPP